MHTVNSSSDSGASQGARRATGDGPESAAPAKSPVTHSEVVPRARRRHFSNADKRRFLKACDRCTKPGEIGALMRREGVYQRLAPPVRRRVQEDAEVAQFGLGKERRFDPQPRRPTEPLPVPGGEARVKKHQGPFPSARSCMGISPASSRAR